MNQFFSSLYCNFFEDLFGHNLAVIWIITHLMNRAQTYTWLSKQLGMERDYTHIGMFDVETCKKVIAVSNNYLNEKAIDKSTKTL